MAHSEMPDRIYAELDPDTNDKRWYSTLGMGEEFVRGSHVSALRDTLRDAMAELLTIAGEPVPGEQIDLQKYAATAVEHLQKKMRMLGIRLNQQ